MTRAAFAGPTYAGAHRPILEPPPDLICPICRGVLDAVGGTLVCRNAACRTEFPLVDGIPVLINEANSLFTIAGFVGREGTFFSKPDGRLATLGMKVLDRLPDITRSIGTRERYAKLAEMLLRDNPAPVVLVVGGSIVGNGMEEFLAHPAIRFVETDIAFGPRTRIICDSHDMPFRDGTFDAVIAQAVLEHVVDPARCVAEIHRVLKSGGLVYAETPFMQQVHGGRYDFTRWTHLGHRRLFRWFAEVESGVVCGPGMALAWSWNYFALSAATSRAGRALAHLVTRLTGSWLTLFDAALVTKPGAYDAAAGYHFLGRRSDEALPDRELITLYQGGRQ